MSYLPKLTERGLWSPLFRDFFEADPFFNFLPGGSMPAANISETDREYCIELAVPGFKKNDFKVRVDKDVLTVSAENETQHKDEGQEYSRREYNYSSFSRSFRLPENIKEKSITAKYESGILKLELPKTAVQLSAGQEIPVV
jgi:HSP20 family protein